MEFDKSKVYTALNADELKVGSKVICASCLANLKEYVANYSDDDICDGTCIITSILDETHGDRFQIRKYHFPLVYLISEPEEKNWIVYIHRNDNIAPYLTSCRSDKWEYVKEEYGAKTKLFEGTENETDRWYTSRRHFADVIASWEDGKTIQYNSGNGWEDCCDNKPLWDTDTQYRIKQEGLKWTDLKIGDIIRCGDISFMITGVCNNDTTNVRVCFNGNWYNDYELKGWEKVKKK